MGKLNLRLGGSNPLTIAVTTLWFLAALCVGSAFAQETNPPAPLLLAHYMPWFVAKPVSPTWGWHWTMGHFSPDSERVGERRIASYYTPLIGPYDSSDPDVIEYHLLTMKMAGIDGLIVDWYGLSDHADYPILKRNSDLLLKAATQFGLKIGVCYEDQTVTQLEKAGKLATADRVKHVQLEIDWLKTNWFSNPAYLKLNGRPVLLSFGNEGLTDAEWQQALAPSNNDILYLSEHGRRGSAAGAFDWPSPNTADSSSDSFYRDSPNWPVAMPAAFPRFHDIYKEAKVGDGYQEVSNDNGARYEKTLRRALDSHAPLVQLVTWNDWGEGTNIEPSVEFGFRDLETTQRLRRELFEPKFKLTADDLRLPYQIFQLRKKGAEKARLDHIAELLAAGSVEPVRQLVIQLQKH